MSELVIGWKVTSGLEPEYWLPGGAQPGDQKPEDLITVQSNDIGTHTIIIGQSGSGKSFFLGRFIEEILLKTKSRCVILDPNSDFRMVHGVENRIWEKAKYDQKSRRGKLPDEKSCEEFSKKWEIIPKYTYIHTQYEAQSDMTQFKDLRLWWPNIASNIIAQDDDPYLRSQLYHCHEFVKAIGYLTAIRPKSGNDGKSNILEPIEISEDLWKNTLR